jgi:hypothetical protein
MTRQLFWRNLMKTMINVMVALALVAQTQVALAQTSVALEAQKILATTMMQTMVAQSTDLQDLRTQVNLWNSKRAAAKWENGAARFGFTVAELRGIFGWTGTLAALVYITSVTFPERLELQRLQKLAKKTAFVALAFWGGSVVLKGTAEAFVTLSANKVEEIDAQVKARISEIEFKQSQLNFTAQQMTRLGATIKQNIMTFEGLPKDIRTIAPSGGFNLNTHEFINTP